MMNIETIKQNRDNKSNLHKQDKSNINKTLQGVLVNSHLRIPRNEKYNFDYIQDSLLINNSQKYYSSQKNIENNEESVFDTKKAIAPLFVTTIGILSGCLALSTGLKKSSATLLKTKNFEQLPDLAINMNIKEEPQFAIYRAIRDSNFRNIIGAAGVFLMSGITIGCKNFVDGVKEIWVKKRSADIEKNLQENLISVERDAFSGKLKVVNDMMNESISYFETVINSDLPVIDITSFKREKSKNIFEPFTVFRGKSENKENEKNTKNLKYFLMSCGIILSGALTGKICYSNLKKTMQNAQTFADNYSKNTIDAIKNISNKADNKNLPTIIELMKSMHATPEFVEMIGEKYKLTEQEIKNIIGLVEEENKTIFADAPTALGGVPKKIQYYCYIDEPRGHFYNWIMNPDNKFTKYIFQAFTVSSAIGYAFKQGMDALKETAVINENAKTDLDLKKRLVAVEIESFRAKKESAVLPLIDSFTHQANEGKKSKKELKQLADNILMEIKNGPPYVYN